MFSYSERNKAKDVDYYGVIHANCDDIIDEFIAEGRKFDLILTDPPYNVGKDFGNNTDSLPVDTFLSEMKTRIKKLCQLLSEEGSIIWFGIHDYICYIQVYMYEVGLYYRRLNIWHYENGFSRSKKEPATHYEPFLWFSKNSKRWTYNADEVRVPYKSTERLKSPIRYKTNKGEEKIWKPNEKGSLRGDVWDFPTLAGKAFQKERTEHPTQKPESLITELIKAFCPMKTGKLCGTILDPFHGSGTLGVCCEKLNKEGNYMPKKGSHDVHYLLEKIAMFPHSNDMRMYFTTFQILRLIALNIRDCKLKLDEAFFDIANETEEQYIYRISKFIKNEKIISQLQALVSIT